MEKKMYVLESMKHDIWMHLKIKIALRGRFIILIL